MRGVRCGTKGENEDKMNWLNKRVEGYIRFAGIHLWVIMHTLPDLG